ncbi:MAG: toprim domain-containing protein [Bacteroidota bacterium]
MTIQETKHKLTLSQVLHHYNLKPDKNLRLNCPFHEDKTPSLQVYYKTHTAYCFSSNCKTHGKSLDVIDFIMYKENVTKAEAILKAMEMISPLNPPKGEVTHVTHENKMKPSISREQILQNMFTYFKNAVHNSKPAQEYIKQRGLDATKIEVGYNTAQFHHGARRDETLINNCVSIGLLSPWGTSKTGEQAYKPFAKFGICFAMRNKGNHITGLYFRSTVNDNNAKHYYLKESTGLYPKYPNAETQKLIIAESIIDTASLLQIESIANNYTLLASYGTNRLNEEIQNAIKELPNLKEIIFAFDNDEAGNKAVDKYAKELLIINSQLLITKLELPCKDVNETLQAYSEDIFIHLLEQRQNIFLSNEKKKEVESIVKSVVTEPNKLNTSNPYKLNYQTETAIYLIKGGVDKVMSKLNITLEIINEQLNESINKRRFKVDLYDNKQIEKLVQEANELLQLAKSNLENDIHELTEALDHYREREMQSTTTEEQAEPSVYLLTPQEKNEALQLAKDKNLIKTITEKLTQTGIIGEDENKTFLFVVGASHIQENPLNALIQGSSGSGKTNLLKGVFKIMPEESKKIYSRCSEKMLYNVPKYYFKNKLICFEDVDGLGEEAEYAWRELVSNGELISGVSYKDEKGNIGIKELTVYGPITSIACTTKGAIYADNMSRLFLIAIDESKEQTQKINEYQAKEASGQINKQEQQQAIKQLQNYIRILAPYQVHNPHATKLKLPEGIRDERRLYRLYLYFIDMITVLHQYQRKKTEQGKLIATKQDCQIAKDLMFECIMLKMDELDGSLRQFFERLKDYIKTKNNDKYSFTQREIRTALNVSKTHLFRFITELKFMEYLQENQYNGNVGNTYQIRYWDDYKKVKEEVKEFMQNQINQLVD